MREAGGDGTIEEIGLGETELETALQVAELRGEGERFAETEEIVGLIGEADEAAGKTADAALQADGLLAFFFQLEVEIDGAFLGVALDLDGLVFFDALEIVELVEAEDADFPGALVEELAFVEKQFAANHFVASGGVAAEVDAADVVLLFLVEAHGDVDAFGGVVDIGLRFGSEIDETVLAVDLGVILHGLADLGGGEDVAFLEGEDVFEGVDFEREGFVGVGADDFQRAHLVAFAFFDGDGDVDGFAVGAAGEGNAEAVALGVEIFEDGLADDYLEVAVVLIQAANADFEVFVELLGVVGLGEDGDVGEPEGDGIRAVVTHRANDFAAAERVIAGEADVADFYLRSFFDLEDENDGVAGGDAFVLWRDFGVLVAVLAEEIFEDDFGFLDARGIELAFHGEADFLFLEAVENVGFGNGVNAVVADAADDRALFDFEDDVLVAGTVR